MNQDEKDLKDTNEQTQDNSDKSSNVEENSVTQSDQKKSEDINLTTETESVPEPKKVERKIKHPKTDVVRYDDPELDSNYGWAIEFPSSETLEIHWNKLKSFLDNNAHPIKGKVAWLSLDPRGYFSARIRYFISFTGWGIQVDSLPEWYKRNISEITKPSKSIEPSEELAEGNWQGYIVKEKIDLKGSEYIKLDKFSRNKRKTIEEAKKPVSSNISRYWCQKPLFTARDYLIPVITEEKLSAKETTSISYLEEYIVEQLDWKESEENKDSFIILPPEFTYDESATRKIKIPEEYTPEINYDYPGMFPGMGGLGGMGMPDLGDMPDIDESELGDLDSDEIDQDDEDETNDEDSEQTAEDTEEKSDAIDAEVVPDDK